MMSSTPSEKRKQEIYNKIGRPSESNLGISFPGPFQEYILIENDETLGVSTPSLLETLNKNGIILSDKSIRHALHLVKQNHRGVNIHQ